MKRTSSLLLVFFISPFALAECMLIGHLKRDGAPRFELMSCQTVEHYSSELDPEAFRKWKEYFAGATDSDLAVSVRARNKVGTNYIFGGSKTTTWHYKGSCEDLPLHTEVEVEFTQSCCEFSTPSLYCYFPAEINKVDVANRSH